MSVGQLTFFASCYFVICVFCLLVVLVKLSVPMYDVKRPHTSFSTKLRSLHPEVYRYRNRLFNTPSDTAEAKSAFENKVRTK